MRYIAGIDPGITAGAISLIGDTYLYSWVLPKAEKGLDLPELCRLISDIQSNYNPIFILEDVHAVFGSAAGSTFAMGRGLGNIEAALCCNDCEYELIQPKVWQKLVIKEQDIVYKDPTANRKVRDTKATALAAIKRIYPNTDFIYGLNEKIGKRKKFHEGIVDATLIAYSKII